MKILIRTIKILLFIVCFFAAMYYFLEWKAVGNFAMSFAHSQLERQGMRMSYSDVSGEDGGFTINNMTLNGMANISLASITIKPQLAASVKNLAPVCNICFRGLSIQLGQVMNFGDGEFTLTAWPGEVELNNLRTNGDFALNGYVTIDLSAMKLGHTEAKLDVPENFASNMGMLRNFLPLVQDGKQWYLRRR